MVEVSKQQANSDEPDAARLRCGRGAFFYMHGSRFIQETEMIIDDDDLDEWFDEEESEEIICPECGSNDLLLIGEFHEESSNEFECNDCGERFTEGEEEG